MKSTIVSVFTPYTLTFYRVNFLNGNFSLLAKFDSKSNEMIHLNRHNNQIKKVLKNYIYPREDSYRENKFKIDFNYEKTKLMVFGKSYILPGYIDRCFLARDCCIFSFNNFLEPTKIYRISKSNVPAERIYRDTKLKYKHKYYGKLNTPVYDFYQGSEEYILFIHGGPNSYYRPQYDILISEFIKMGKNVMLINYPGSPGYDENFRKSLYKNGGKKDFESIKDIIINIQSTGASITIIGESYGGYLSVLLSILADDVKVDKYISISGFTDINYQYLFSPSKNVIEKYFNTNNFEEIKSLNPINLINDYKLNSKLIFIHGEDDKICDIKQIRHFIEIYKSKYNYTIPLIAVNELPHDLMKYNDKQKVVKILKKLFRGNLYAEY